MTDPQAPTDSDRFPAKLPYSDAVEYFHNLLQEFKDARENGKATILFRSEELKALRDAYHSFKVNAPLAAELAALRVELETEKAKHNSMCELYSGAQSRNRVLSEDLETAKSQRDALAGALADIRDTIFEEAQSDQMANIVLRKIDAATLTRKGMT